jgi:hypothetical protein
MEHVPGYWGRSWQRALTAAAGCSVLASCSLITSFDGKSDDDSDKKPEIEEHDGSARPQGKHDASSGDDAADPSEPQTEPDASRDPVVVAVPDSGSDPTDNRLPEAGAPTEPGPSAEAGAEAGARPSVKDLIDAVDGERKDRTDRVCACPGARQECAQAGLGKSSCLGRSLELLSGTAQESVRALLECLLPAEAAYTDCVERRLSCRDVQATTGTCSAQYELATARCNTMSIQGLSLQGLCSSR